MLIRRLPQPSLARKCLTYAIGPRLDPALDRLNVVCDNLRLAYRLYNEPHALEMVGVPVVADGRWALTHPLCSLCSYHSQAARAYQLRYVAEYKRRFDEAMTPEKKPTPGHDVPVSLTGLTYPALYRNK